MQLRITVQLQRFIVAFAGLVLSLSVRAQQKPIPDPVTIEGVALDASTGEPISGVRVNPPWPFWLPPPPPDGGDIPYPLVQTDASGRFSRAFVYSENEFASIGFNKDGYDVRWLRFRIVPGERIGNAVVRLERTKSGVLSGKVTDSGGNPAANVGVTLYFSSSGGSLLTGPTRYSDDRGEYRFFNLEPRRYIVGFSDPRYASPGRGQMPGPIINPIPLAPFLYPGVGDASSAEIVEVANKSEVRLRNTSIGSARLGRVLFRLNNQSSPARDFYLILHSKRQLVHLEAGEVRTFEDWPDHPTPVSIGFARTDQFEPLAPLYLAVAYDGRERDVEIRLADVDSVLPVRVLLEEPGGQAVPFHDALASVVISPRADTIGPSGRATLNMDGTAQVKSLYGGLYDVYLAELPPNVYVSSASQGERDVLAAPVRVSANSEALEIRLRRGAGTLSGTVTDREGRSAQSAMVLVLPDDANLPAEQIGVRRYDTTVQGGQFEVPGLVPGRYRVYAARDVDVRSWDDHVLRYIDPTFLSRFRTDGVLVTVEENGRPSVKVKLLED